MEEKKAATRENPKKEKIIKEGEANEDTAKRNRSRSKSQKKAIIKDETA